LPPRPLISPVAERQDYIRVAALNLCLTGWVGHSADLLGLVALAAGDVLLNSGPLALTAGSQGLLLKTNSVEPAWAGLGQVAGLAAYDPAVEAGAYGSHSLQVLLIVV
jgi:hypothetical protein